MEEQAKIWIVGSLNADLVQTVERLPTLGETVRGGDLRTCPGGKGANQAYAAAQQGAATVMIGNVGEDQFGTLLLDSLASVDVDTTRVNRVETATGTASIFIAPNGESSIVISPGANAILTPADVRERLHGISSQDYLLCQLETPIDTVLEALQYAKKAGATTILDPAPAADFTDELLPFVDFITPNETETSSILDTPIISTTNTLELEAVAEKLRQRGATGIILKLGATGCYYDENDISEFVAGHSVNAVDTTGAGDTFNAAFAAHMLESASIMKSLQWANAAGALCVTRPGAQASIPSRDEVQARTTQYVA